VASFQGARQAFLRKNQQHQKLEKCFLDQGSETDSRDSLLLEALGEELKIARTLSMLMIKLYYN
jgi:hypothetical protein